MNPFAEFAPQSAAKLWEIANDARTPLKEKAKILQDICDRGGMPRVAGIQSQSISYTMTSAEAAKEFAGSLERREILGQKIKELEAKVESAISRS